MANQFSFKSYINDLKNQGTNQLKKRKIKKMNCNKKGVKSRKC